MSYRELRARHLARVHRELPGHIRRLEWSREQILAEQTRGLQALVAHARAHSPFYAERLAGLELSDLKATDITRLPVTTKQQVMGHWDQIVTVPGVTLEVANHQLEELRQHRLDNPYHDGQYLFLATGGSSGQRGVFLWEWDFFVTTACVTFRHLAKALESDSPCRLAVIHAGELVHGSTFLFSVGIGPQMEVHEFSAGTPVSVIAERMQALQPTHLIGYSSLVHELAEATVRGRVDLRPGWVSTNSEPLAEDTREAVRRAWGVEITNTYGSVEVGVVAVEGPGHDGMELCEDCAIFEFVDDEHRPVLEGQQATRVLVTHLSPRAMPLIRYELTDLVRPLAPTDSGFRRIADIDGRADNWLTYAGGIRIHPIVYRAVLGQQPGILEYQVIQTPRGARILAIAQGEVHRASVCREVERSLVEAGLAGAEVTLEVVDALPRHPETHKLKRFVLLAGV